MAKSARASSVKKNNQRLKKNVFGPVETARNNRLSAKLLELATQPKTPRTEMEIEQSSMPPASSYGGQQKGSPPEPSADTMCSPTDEDMAKKEDKNTDEGGLTFYSTPIPMSFHHRSLPMDPTPRPTDLFLICDDTYMFYHWLGIADKIAGFDAKGHLRLSFPTS